MSYFGSLSTMTQIESFPLLDIGKLVIKSIPTESHFHSGICKGCKSPRVFDVPLCLSNRYHIWLCSFRLLASSYATKIAPSNPDTSWFLQGGWSKEYYGLLAKYLVSTLNLRAHRFVLYTT